MSNTPHGSEPAHPGRTRDRRVRLRPRLGPARPPLRPRRHRPAARPGTRPRRPARPRRRAPTTTGLTPIEQEEIPAGKPLDEFLGTIAWPDAVVGCALTVERLMLPPSAEASVPEGLERGAARQVGRRAPGPPGGPDDGRGAARRRPRLGAAAAREGLARRRSSPAPAWCRAWRRRWRRRSRTDAVADVAAPARRGSLRRAPLGGPRGVGQPLACTSAGRRCRRCGSS